VPLSPPLVAPPLQPISAQMATPWMNRERRIAPS
jgi:hypothetical protein